MNEPLHDIRYTYDKISVNVTLDNTVLVRVTFTEFLGVHGKTTLTVYLKHYQEILVLCTN